MIHKYIPPAAIAVLSAPFLSKLPVQVKAPNPDSGRPGARRGHWCNRRHQRRRVSRPLADPPNHMLDLWTRAIDSIYMVRIIIFRTWVSTTAKLGPKFVFFCVSI